MHPEHNAKYAIPVKEFLVSAYNRADKKRVRKAAKDNAVAYGCNFDSKAFSVLLDDEHHPCGFMVHLEALEGKDRAARLKRIGKVA